MNKQIDLDILSLEWASKVMGAHLEIEKLIQEIIRYLEKRIPRKKIRLLLWDETKKKFVLEAASGIKGIVAYPKVGSDILKAINHKAMVWPPIAKASGLKEPLSSDRFFLIPLTDKAKFLGVLLIGSSGTKDRVLKNKEEVLGLASLVSTVLANAQLFVESEMRNLDMFRFNVLSRALNPTVHQEEVVKILMEGLEGIIKFDIAGLLVLGKHKNSLFIKAKIPLTQRCIQVLQNSLLKLIFDLTKKTLDIENLNEKITMPEGKPSNLKINSCLNSPLIIKDRIVGVLNLYSFEKEHFSARDGQNISILASHGAVAFENAMLYEDLKRTYFSIINALTSAIEAKDEYTRGHSVFVSKYSVAIATEMGLSASMIESIQIAGLLHDLGKIGVPEEILVKKGKLTENEYQIVKAHPEIALKILGPVEFPHFAKEGTFTETPPELTLSLFEQADLSADVKLMIYHHHEKYGGGGYPKGIKKEEIPLGARILAVADTFEALTADRPYRKAFSLNEAKKILLQISNEQLDPAIVKVFLKILNTKGMDALKKQIGF